MSIASIRKKNLKLVALFLALLMGHISVPIQAIAVQPSSRNNHAASRTDSGTVKSKARRIENAVSASSTSVHGGSASGPGSGAVAPEVSNNSGAAIYRIPIEVPPGRAGIQPNIAISYNSHRRNGWLGVGFDIDLGSIQRSTRHGLDYTADEYVAVMYGSSADLVPRGHDLWGGANHYGAKIEREFLNFYHDKDGTGGWVVTNREGTKYYYGTNLASLSRLQNMDPGSGPVGIFRWYLDRVEDVNGNYMTVTYQQGPDGLTPQGNQLYPREIQYSGNTGKGTIGGGSTAPLAPDRSVFFTLARTKRTDAPIDYSSHWKRQTFYRLQSIKVSCQGSLVRRYDLQYEASPSPRTGRSLLSSVTQYGSDGSSLPAITFQWQKGAEGFSSAQRWGTQTTPMGDSYGRAMGDLNGDGNVDYVFYTGDSDSSSLRVMLGSKTGLGTEEVWKWTGNSLPYHLDDSPLITDVNGDGKGDYIFDDGSSFCIFLSKKDEDGFRDMVNYPRAPYEDDFRPHVFADLDGDGKADLLYRDADDELRVRKGTDSGLEATEGIWAYDAGIIEDQGGFGMGDVNGDGKADFIYEKGIGVGLPGVYTVRISTGSGFRLMQDWGSSPKSREEYFRGVRGGDLNGDGLSDIVVVTAAHEFQVLLNNGMSFTTSGFRRSEPVEAYTFGRPLEVGGSGYLVADVNGDGLGDILYWYTSQWVLYWRAFISTGSSFVRADEFSVDLSFCTYDFHGDGNGDGLLDYVFWNATIGQDIRILKGNPPMPDLLAKIDNGQGGLFTLTYTPSSGAGYNNTNLPYVVQTLTNIVADDGYGHTSRTGYSYSGGYHSHAEREFRGFESVTRINPDGSSVLTKFYQGKETPEDPEPGFAGLPYQITLRDADGATYKQVINTYQALDAPYRFTIFPALTQVEEKIYGANGSFRDLLSRFEYDPRFGTITRRSLYGDENTEGRIEYATYVTDTDNWILSLPSRITICSERNVTCDHSDPNQLASTQFSYYDGTTLPSVKKLWMSYPGESPGWIVFSYREYEYGNVKKAIDPKGNATTYTYDQSTYIFPETITRWPTPDLALTTTSIWDSKFGARTRVTDPNGISTRLRYDGFGRIISEILPGDTLTLPTRSYEYHDAPDTTFSGPGRMVKVRERIESGTDQEIWKEMYTDGLGREVKARSQGPLDANGIETVIETETQYNPRGLVKWKTDPHFAAPSPPPQRRTTYTYDGMGRALKVFRQVEGAPRYTIREASYTKDSTTYFDANKHKKVEYRDAFGRLTTVEEYTGDGSATQPHALYATTRYEYDALGNLTLVTDDEGNQTVITYDSLSRKRSMDDPDMGYWAYIYDLNGNLASQTDARSNTISFEYDGINRITHKLYSDPSEAPAVYEYDRPSANGLGRLALVTDGSGSMCYYYDQRGRIIREDKSIIADASSTITRTTRKSYDALNRVASVTYPDREVLRYEYDAATLKKVTAGAQELATYSDYTALGQVGRIAYGNGVTTSYTYDDPMNRLKTLTTSNGFQRLGYEYDKVGNIVAVQDYAIPENSWTYSYDDINRLTEARRGSNGTTYECLLWTYSTIGNVTSHGPRSFEYTDGSGHPHAVKHVVVLNRTYDYRYDENGNMIERDGVPISYDSDNRPVQIGPTLSFAYDSQGSRVKKSASPESSTLYFGSTYECECTNASCTAPGTTSHYFAGGQRIAWKDSSGTYHYYHSDHLQGLSRVSDSQGVSQEKTEFYPFGQSRLDRGTVNYKYKYTGKELDSEYGLYYYGARYYDPSIGRFISADSIVQAPNDPQTLNRYSYCRNNPLIYIDPTGHIWGVVIAAIIGAIMAGMQSDWNPQTMVFGAVVGGVSGGVYGGVESAVASSLQGVVQSAIVSGAISGAAGGAAAGAVAGGLNAACYGGNVAESILMGAGIGAATGATFGALKGYLSSRAVTSDSLSKSKVPIDVVTDERFLLYSRGEGPAWMDAGIDTTEYWNPKSIEWDRELLGTGFGKGNGDIVVPYPNLGKTNWGTPIQVMPEGQFERAFFWHTHGALTSKWDVYFTTTDLATATRHSLPIFLGSPICSVKFYAPWNFQGPMPFGANAGQVYMIVQ